MSRPEVLVGRPGIGAKLGSVGYGYRLRFYTTDDGLKAAFELALDPEGTTWEQASDEYAPDSAADTDVGATVAAAGITIPAAGTGVGVHGTPSGGQQWSWLLDGNGNIPLTLPTTGKGLYYLSVTHSHSGANGTRVASGLCNTDPSGNGYFIGFQKDSSGPRAIYSYNNGVYTTGTVTTGLNQATLRAGYKNSGTPTFTGMNSRWYDSGYSDYTSHYISLSNTIGTPVFSIVAAKSATMSSSAIVTLESILSWNERA